MHLGAMKRDKVSVVAGADTEHEETVRSTTEFLLFHAAKVQPKSWIFLTASALDLCFL